MLAPAFSTHHNEIAIIKTVAQEGKGVNELYAAIKEHLQKGINSEKKLWLLTEKAWHLIQKEKMKGVNKEEIRNNLQQQLRSGYPNLYQLVRQYS